MTENNDGTKYYSTVEALKYLKERGKKMSRSTLERLARRNTFKSYRQPPSRLRLYKVDDLNYLVDEETSVVEYTFGRRKMPSTNGDTADTAPLPAVQTRQFRPPIGRIPDGAFALDTYEETMYA